MKRLSLRWKIFLIGFGLSVPLLALEYLSGGWFPASLLFLPFSLAAEPVARRFFGTPWYPMVFGAVAVLASAFWWYVVAGIVEVLRRRRRRGSQVSHVG